MERRVEEMVNGELLMVNEKMKKWKEVKFEDLYLEPSRNGLSRPTHVRGSGIKMVNMKEIFSYDLISNVNMELVPVNDKEIELMTLKEGDLLFARQSLVLGKNILCQKVIRANNF
jgi:type I restriction enzyme S subunit